jgi:fatty acid-binding protein DegV
MTAMVPIAPHLTPEEYDLLLIIIAKGRSEVYTSCKLTKKLMDLGVVAIDSHQPGASWGMWVAPTDRVAASITFEPPPGK